MYTTCIFVLFSLLNCICIDCDTRLNMDQTLKVLDITDEDFIDNCDYLDKDTDLHYTLGSKDDLNIAQINIRGLIGKQCSIIKETTIENSNKTIDLYILCETWLTEHNNNMVNIPSYTYVGKHRSHKKGGGVGFLIHDSLAYTERTDIKLPHTSELESIFIEIRTRNSNIIVGSMYRPPPPY